jgi:hypothetical protein
MQGFYCNPSDVGFTKVMGDLELGESAIFHNVAFLFHHAISFRTFFLSLKTFFKILNSSSFFKI